MEVPQVQVGQVAQIPAGQVTQVPTAICLVYTDKSTELVTRVRYYVAIPMIQFHLCRMGFLEDLDLKSYFGPSS
jgi:hypothetical protein